MSSSTNSAAHPDHVDVVGSEVVLPELVGPVTAPVRPAVDLDRQGQGVAVEVQGVTEHEDLSREAIALEGGLEALPEGLLGLGHRRPQEVGGELGGPVPLDLAPAPGLGRASLGRAGIAALDLTRGGVVAAAVPADGHHTRVEYGSRPVHGPARHRCGVVEHQGHAGGRGDRRRGRIGLVGGAVRHPGVADRGDGRLAARGGATGAGGTGRRSGWAGSWGWGSPVWPRAGRRSRPTGRPWRPIIAWHDRRGEAVAERLTRRLRGRPRSVDRPAAALRGDGGQARVAGRAGLAADAPAGWRWLGVPELVLRALTGAEATEWSLAARTGCFDVGSTGVAARGGGGRGFDVGVFPPVMAAGEVMGRVTAQASAWSGAAGRRAGDGGRPRPSGGVRGRRGRAPTTWSTRSAPRRRWWAARPPCPTSEPPWRRAWPWASSPAATAGWRWPARPGRARRWTRPPPPSARRPPSSTDVAASGADQRPRRPGPARQPPPPPASGPSHRRCRRRMGHPPRRPRRRDRGGRHPSHPRPRPPPTAGGLRRRLRQRPSPGGEATPRPDPGRALARHRRGGKGCRPLWGCGRRPPPELVTLNRP